MRASVGRGVGREGGDKALAANTYPNDECKSNYCCVRKRAQTPVEAQVQKLKKSKGKRSKILRRGGGKGRGNHERIMRRS